MNSAKNSPTPPDKAFPVKQIPVIENRRNTGQRRKKLQRRQAQAGHWRPQSRPMFGRSPVHYEVSGTTQVMGHGGIGLIHRQVTRLGLAAQIDQRLHPLKRHLPYHESDHVLNPAYSILCGGTRLEDVERLQGDLAYMEALGAALIPDPTTASDFCRRFKADEAMALQEAINAVRPTLWRGRGRGLLGPVAYLDYVLAAYMWCGQPGRVCA